MYTKGKQSLLLHKIVMYLKHFMRNTLGWKELGHTNNEIIAAVFEMIRKGKSNMTDENNPDIRYSLSGNMASSMELQENSSRRNEFATTDDDLPFSTGDIPASGINPQQLQQFAN